MIFYFVLFFDFFCMCVYVLLVIFTLDLKLLIAMGEVVSAGRNNNELVDNLCHENYIQTPEVETVRLYYL